LFPSLIPPSAHVAPLSPSLRLIIFKKGPLFTQSAKCHSAAYVEPPLRARSRLFSNNFTPSLYAVVFEPRGFVHSVSTTENVHRHLFFPLWTLPAPPTDIKLPRDDTFFFNKERDSQDFFFFSASLASFFPRLQTLTLPNQAACTFHAFCQFLGASSQENSTRSVDTHKLAPPWDSRPFPGGSDAWRHCPPGHRAWGFRVFVFFSWHPRGPFPWRMRRALRLFFPAQDSLLHPKAGAL